MPSEPSAPRVRLPIGTKRANETYQLLAWRDLLELTPGAVTKLAEVAGFGTPEQCEVLAAGTRIEFYISGWGLPQSDLFVVCDACEKDRILIEVKGPTAQLNRQKSGEWQTNVYTERYVVQPTLICACIGGLDTKLPLFVFLDARSRSSDEIETDIQCADPNFGLTKWAVIGYQELLTETESPFEGHPLSWWLLGE